jgi:cardiolipin synthase A/B
VQRPRRRRVIATLLVLAALIAWRTARHPASGATAALPAAEPAAAAADSLVVEPDAGMAPIYQLLSAPQHTLDMTIYELADPSAEALLADDAARGVRVRVLLDHHLEARRNLAAYDFLRSRRVEVGWASDRYFATHEKAFVIDGRTAVVMSLNLTSAYYATSRDVAVVDRDPRDAAAIESVFDADWRGDATGTPPADDLVWSPGQSQADLLALIDGARRSVAVESEELSNRPVVDALVRAVRRGVAVTVAMTYDPDWRAALDAIAGAGGRVSLYYGESPLYIHAKLMVVDRGTPAARAFVGSENLADTSLLHDRELGLVLVAPALVDAVAAVIGRDVSGGRPWQ